MAGILGRRRRATPAEALGPLVGDELVPRPCATTTRAITIDAGPDDVWPWLVQIGHDRGGLYSYEAVENLIGCDLHNADEIIEELQHPEAGDVIALGPKGYPCYRIAVVDPPSALVLRGADPKTREVVEPVGDRALASTWQWQLTPLDDGRRTRLLARQRLTYPRAQWLLWTLLRPVTCVMERRMLRGIAERAEGARQPTRS